MGLFDFFLSEEKKIMKHQRVLMDIDSQDEDRDLSCRWLAENGSEKALLALCQRFDLKLTQQLKDGSEKEMVFGLLAEQGDKAIRPVRVWLKRCKAIPIPLGLYETLTDEAHTIKLVYDLLNAEIEKDNFKPVRKQALLKWLYERKDPDVIERIAPFLNDFDENVRIAAAEVIIGQGDDKGRDVLLQVLANEDEDSNRLIIRICEVFAARRWSVEGAELAEAFPGGYHVRGTRIVK